MKLALAAALVLLQGAASPPAPMSDEQKQQAWTNEPVILLKDPHTPFKFIGEGSGFGDGTYQFHVLGQPKQGLPHASYAGRTGTIVELKKGRREHFDLVIRLDGSGELIVGSSGYLGFASDLKAAQSLLGKPLWARAGAGLRKPTTSPSSIPDVTFKNAERVVVSKVEPGPPFNAILLCATNGAGQEGCAHLTHFEPRFAPLKNVSSNKEVGMFFHSKDPREQHKSWSAAIWKLIEEQEVAIGMTEEMALLACGVSAKRAGAVLAGDAVSPIYQCGDRKFLVEGGKVTKYLN
jgi:hypothetical protein